MAGVRGTGTIKGSGSVGANESVRVFDERRLLFDDLATVGVIARVVFGGEFRSASFGVTFEGEFLRVGVSEYDFTTGGVSEGSANFGPRDMVSVLALEGVFDVRPLLRWDACLVSGEG